MDEHQVREIFEFIERVMVQELDSSKELLGFIPLFMEKYRSLEAKLPYHINVIDELRAVENAHSRILAKLLQQKTSSEKFELFESFIQYIQEKPTIPVSFMDIQVKRPEITQEIGRIDLWIRDEDYAIVIENKIHWAKDMDEQLAGYINTTKKRYVDEQIYVIYLSSTYHKKPDEQTWGEYKDKYEGRFLHLSFRDDILTWLTEKVLPNVRLKDKFLFSALEQYVDHLHGKFELRDINNKMNMDLQELMKQEWRLNDTPKKNVAELLEKRKMLAKIDEQIELSLRDFEKAIFREYKTKLKAKYPNYQSEENSESVYLIMQVKDIFVRVWMWSNAGKLNCGMDTLFTKDEGKSLPQELIDSVKYLNIGMRRNFPRVEYDDAFELMLEAIEVLISLDNE